MSGQRFERRNHGGGHSYLLDGRKVPGVTTITGLLDKPALLNWSAEVTAKYAVEHWQHLAGLDEIARYEQLKRARRLATKKAADQGKRIHALADRLARGEAVTPPDELRDQVEAYARFLDDWGFETIATEAPVAHRGYQYAGTLDLLCRSDRFGTTLLDVKSGKGIYPEHVLQQSAYRFADVILTAEERFGPRGGKLKPAWVEQPMPHIDSVFIAHIPANSVDVNLHPLVADEASYDVFLYLAEIYHTWIKRVSYDFKTDPAFAPPIGESIHPEQDLTREGFPNE